MYMIQKSKFGPLLKESAKIHDIDKVYVWRQSI